MLARNSLEFNGSNILHEAHCFPSFTFHAEWHVSLASRSPLQSSTLSAHKPIQYAWLYCSSYSNKTKLQAYKSPYSVRSINKSAQFICSLCVHSVYCLHFCELGQGLSIDAEANELLMIRIKLVDSSTTLHWTIFNDVQFKRIWFTGCVTMQNTIDGINWQEHVVFALDRAWYFWTNWILFIFKRKWQWPFSDVQQFSPRALTFFYVARRCIYRWRVGSIQTIFCIFIAFVVPSVFCVVFGWANPYTRSNLKGKFTNKNTSSLFRVVFHIYPRLFIYFLICCMFVCAPCHFLATKLAVQYTFLGVYQLFPRFAYFFCSFLLIRRM